MTQIEKIKAEIERRIKALEKTFPNIYYEGEVCGLKRLLSFIESMEKELPAIHPCEVCKIGIKSSADEPQGLDEASEEYSERETCYANDSHLQKQTTKLAFKAGAKWAAEHGVSYDSTVIHGANDMLFVTALLDGKDFKEGDKVTVQIRKK